MCSVCAAMIISGVVIASVPEFRTRFLWTSICVSLGGILGFVCATVPVWIKIVDYEQRTGYSGGNIGLVCCATIPLLALIGVGVGFMVGSSIDKRRRILDNANDADERTCPQCGYYLIGGRVAGCPECGWNRDTSK